jgi:hypothetical protein
MEGNGQLFSAVTVKQQFNLSTIHATEPIRWVYALNEICRLSEDETGHEHQNCGKVKRTFFHDLRLRGV